MPRIDINIERGGLGRQSTNVDTWAGLYVDVASLPSGWTDNEVKKIYKPEDLEEYGISEASIDLQFKLVYLHVSEFFRLAPNGTLFLQLGANYDIDAIVNAFVAFENRLRLFGIVDNWTELTATPIEAIQTKLESVFASEKLSMRSVVSFKPESEGLLPDFSEASNDRVMVDISSDLTEGGLAEELRNSAIGMSGGCGTILGQLVALSVHQRPSWRSFPINASGKWEKLGDINGNSVEGKTQAELEAYDTNGLVLMSRTTRLPDAFISNSRMAVATSDDFAVITHGRVVDKAIALAYDGLVKSLDGPVYVNAETGKITAEAVSILTRNAYDEINNNMVIGLAGNDVEVSVDPATGSLPLSAVYINPDQDVLQNENIEVQIRIIPVGAAKVITINIGLTLP